MPETIEAEVIEIDGKPPSMEEGGASSEPEDGPGYGERFKGKVLSLDRRWWPLWLFLGVVVVVLLLTVGVVLGAVFLVYSVIRNLIGALLGVGDGHSSGEIRRY